jgi:hypothetical protein
LRLRRWTARIPPEWCYCRRGQHHDDNPAPAIEVDRTGQPEASLFINFSFQFLNREETYGVKRWCQTTTA